MRNPVADLLHMLTGCKDIHFGECFDHPFLPYVTITGQLITDDTVLDFTLPVKASLVGGWEGFTGMGLADLDGPPPGVQIPEHLQMKPKRKRNRRKYDQTGSSKNVAEK